MKPDKYADIILVTEITENGILRQEKMSINIHMVSGFIDELIVLNELKNPKISIGYLEYFYTQDRSNYKHVYIELIPNQ